MLEFEKNLEKLVLGLYEIEALKFGDFKMKVGINSPVYFDLRVIVSKPNLLNLLADMLVTLMGNLNLQYKHICGVPYTALPIATLVSVKKNQSMLVRRKEAKTYGLKKMVEGRFAVGDECVIIEDVVTSGSSILDTVKDLKDQELIVKNSVVVLDRQQGGVQNLEEEGIKMHILLTLTKVLAILLKTGRITQETVDKVNDYISKTQIKPDGTNRNGVQEKVTNHRLTMNFTQRSALTTNPIGRKLFGIIQEKKSTLCVAVDVSTSAELLSIVAKIAPHVCIIKTHADATEDFDKQTISALTKLAREHNFLIMEDRKFGDIGNTVSMQYQQINAWADLVTVHSLPGEGVMQGLKAALRDGQERGCFLVAELSSSGNLITSDYTQATMKMAEAHNDFVVGIVCQSSATVQAPQLIQLTPGVSLEATSDQLGQNYNDPNHVVVGQGADIAVVGRGICKAKDPLQAAKIYKEKLWAAYLERIGG